MKARHSASINSRQHLSQKLLTLSLSLALLAPLALAARAGSGHKDDRANVSTAADLSRVDIPNFGKVDNHYYRGAQPKGDEYHQLAAIGVKTIVDLRNDAKDDARSEALRAGLRYINFPMSDKDYPRPDAAQRFLAIVNNPASWPVYVHCHGGRHRTGAMTAVYRMADDGWDVDRAYQEMKQYDFYTRWGHEALKDYVFDYYRQLQQSRAPQTPAAQAVVSTRAN